MGLILAVIGLVLAYAQITAGINPPMIMLAIGSALGLALVEFIYVFKRVISPIYLGDALVELILIAWWSLDLFLG